jgi:hypothetical protein
VAEERSAGHAEQLKVYAESVALATGKAIEGRFIHLPVSGIDLDNGNNALAYQNARSFMFYTVAH